MTDQSGEQGPALPVAAEAVAAEAVTAEGVADAAGPRPFAFPFLSARWVNLALISYPVEPAALAPHLPPGCEPDLLDGRAFVSLVAFDFLDTRVLGVRWPTFVNFPEINLRFYVRHQGRRGVAFVRELVPQRFVACMARCLYNEPYLAVPMSSRTVEDGHGIAVEHRATLGGREQSIRVSADKPAWRPSRDGTEHFFKEHAWGFGRTRDGRRLIRYEVWHPEWDVYRNPRLTLDWDFAAAYGTSWGFLNGATPFSVVLAQGSAIRVYPKGTLAVR